LKGTVAYFAKTCRPPFYLQGVGEEVVVEHGPVLAADVHDDLAELVADEVGHGFVLGQQQLGQAVADLNLVLGSHAHPLLIHQVLTGVPKRRSGLSSYKMAALFTKTNIIKYTVHMSARIGFVCTCKLLLGEVSK